MALASNLPLQLCIQVTDTPAEPGFGSLVQQHKVVPGRNWMMGSHVDCGWPKINVPELTEIWDFLQGS